MINLRRVVGNLKGQTNMSYKHMEGFLKEGIISVFGGSCDFMLFLLLPGLVAKETPLTHLPSDHMEGLLSIQFTNSCSPVL